MPDTPFPYAFSPRRKIGREVVRVLRQIARRLAALRRARPADDTETVHEIRTTIKLLRTLLWFGRPGFAPTASAFAKIQLQNAARLLSPRRDATAMHAVLKDLREETDSTEEIEAVHRTAALLHAHAPKVKPAMLLRQRNEAIADVQKTIRELLHAAAAASWKSPGRRLKKARAAAGRAEETARSEPTPENLHSWRKKAKRLLYLLMLFHPRPKGKKKRRINAVDELQHLLGDHHDTVVLQTHLARTHSRAADQEFKPLFQLLEMRLKRLRQEAKKTAREV